MNLALSEDQRMIRDAAAGFLADASDAAAVRKAMQSASGIDDELWQGIVDMGWCGTAVPEEFGGLGLGPVELVLILEQMGCFLACAPFFSSVALATNLLVHAGSAAGKKKYLPALATGRMRGTAALAGESAGVKAKKGKGDWLLSGTVAALVDGAAAELAFVPAGAAVYAIGRGPGVRAKPLQTYDATRRLADLQLKDAPAERIDDPAKKSGLAKARSLAQLYLAAEQLGGAQQCLDLVVRYTSERKQFGRAIASFQAVKHRCAQMMVKIEGLRSLVYGAAASQDPMDCLAAKALASETFFHCAGEAIQLHGGVGFTWEFEPQLHFKRAQATSHALGTAEDLRESLAEALL